MARKKVYKRLEYDVIHDLHNCCKAYLELEKLSKRSELSERIPITYSFTKNAILDTLEEKTKPLVKALPKKEKQEEKDWILRDGYDLNIIKEAIEETCDLIIEYRDLCGGEEKLPPINTEGKEEYKFLNEAYKRLLSKKATK